MPCQSFEEFDEFIEATPDAVVVEGLAVIGLGLWMLIRCSDL